MKLLTCARGKSDHAEGQDSMQPPGLPLFCSLEAPFVLTLLRGHLQDGLWRRLPLCLLLPVDTGLQASQ